MKRHGRPSAARNNIKDLSVAFLYRRSLLCTNDFKIFNSILSIDDCVELQTDIWNVEHWCRINGMALNLEKCYVMRASRRSNPIMLDY